MNNRHARDKTGFTKRKSSPEIDETIDRLWVDIQVTGNGRQLAQVKRMKIGKICVETTMLCDWNRQQFRKFNQ